MVVNGVCCGYCEHVETNECPVTEAAPWSKWKNWCSDYTPNQGIAEAKTLVEALCAGENEELKRLSREVFSRHTVSDEKLSEIIKAIKAAMSRKGE